VEATLEPVVEHGVKHYAKASTLSNAGLLGAQVAVPGGHLRRVSRGMPDRAKRGPILTDCAYPDVLVARAVSDGSDLRLVLRPGTGGGRQPLAIADLREGQTYDVSGGLQRELIADLAGRGVIEVDLADRVELAITPRA
jgi:hypothetical protein